MITLVTGGSGSGKSEYAEGLILDSPCSRRFYVATMIAYGKEGRDKVERHRVLRKGKGFITIEKPRNVGEVMVGEYETGLSPLSRTGRALLLECVSNLAANEMFKEGTGKTEAGEQQGGPIQCLSHKIAEDIISLAGQVQDMVIVTNEVDRDGICYEPETMEYIRLMGCLNQKLASAADRVVEVVYGIPVLLKPSALGPAAIGADLLNLSVGAAALTGAAIPLLVTGGIHMDGFLDTMDAIHSYGDRSRKLEILKDPHLGAFAVISFGVYMMLYLGVFHEYLSLVLREDRGDRYFLYAVPCLVFVMERAFSGLSVVTFPQAKKKGLAAGFGVDAYVPGSRCGSR